MAAVAPTGARRYIGEMSEIAPHHGHVILVAAPSADGRPVFRGYIVAEDDVGKAQAIVARHIQPGETTYVLSPFPVVLLRISSLERGGVLRL